MNATKVFWPAALALVLSLGLVAWLYPGSRAQRVTNLDPGRSGFGETYLMLDRTEAGKGYVVDRRDSTIRRADKKQPGRKWRIDRVSGPNGDLWLTRSKRKGKGTVLYVPVEEVDDWTYPFLYAFVDAAHPELDLPDVRWTQLHPNRLYDGLYLRVALPFDLRKKDGGSGVLRQVLVARGIELRAINTRFDDALGVYAASVAEGLFPELAEPTPELAWLARQKGGDAITFEIANESPYPVRLLPLPVEIDEIFAALNGRPPKTFEDRRYTRWTRASWTEGEATVFTGERAAELESAFAEYAASFRDALRIHAQLRHRSEFARAELPKRQAAGAALGLELGEI